MRPALVVLLLLAISACTPLVCNNGRDTDPLLCGREEHRAVCSTDTDCARFGGNGDPEPDEWAGDTCAETDEGCPGDEPY